MGLESGFVRVARPAAWCATTPWRVVFHDLHLVQRRQHRVGRHVHADYELLLIQSGTWRGSVDGRHIAAQAPSLVAVGPGQTHEDDCPGPLRMCVLHLGLHPGPTPGMSAALTMPGSAAVTPLSSGTAADFDGLARTMAATAREADPFTGPQLDGLAAAFLWRWVGLLPASALTEQVSGFATSSAFATQLFGLFQRNLRVNLGLAEMAAALGMPPRSLTWRCQRSLGEAPTRLFRRYRLRAAREALVGSDLAVSAVAEYFGFASQTHFATVFRREFGHPPNDHRRPQKLP
jgi:AraC-like DNA-binding protein